MQMSAFIRERGQAYADNAVATLLLIGGSVATGWAVNHFAPLWGLDPAIAFVLAWVVALLVAVALSLLLKPKAKQTAGQAAPAQQTLTQNGIVNAPHFENKPHFEFNPQININTDSTAQAGGPETFSRPAFKVTVPVTSYPGLVRLDLNLFQRTKPTEDGEFLPDTFLPILAEFENLPLSDGRFGEVKDVWAQISYRAFDFLGVELVRVTSGCWVEQAVPDISFPLRTPRYLILGGWRMIKGVNPKNAISVFEYSRELHRAFEKTELPGPRRILIEQNRIVIDVVLTSNAHHGQSCEYQFQLTIFGPTGYSIKCVKWPREGKGPVAPAAPAD